MTDHKPLVKILGDRTLDEITNTRLFRLKQRTLPWRFEIVHMSGKSNHAADATSRHPSPSTSNYAGIGSLSLHTDMDKIEHALMAAICREAASFTALSWDRLTSETAMDPGMSTLITTIEKGFPAKRHLVDDSIGIFWKIRKSLYITDGVIMFEDRIVPRLCNKIPYKYFMQRTKVYLQWSPGHEQSSTGQASLRTFAP